MRNKGTLMMALGLVLAILAGLTVLGISRSVAKSPDKQVYVVMAVRDIPELTVVSADALTLKPFPEEFLPQGALAAPEQAVGKYTTMRVIKDQILVDGQLSASRRAGSLAASVTEGKVALSLRIPDAMNAIGALRPGDHVDVLLTLNLLKAQSKDNQQSQDGPGSLSTQTTLQNVEVLNIGAPEGADGTARNAQSGPAAATGNSVTPVTFLVTPQEAITLKFVKDSGGSIDLVLRSPDDKGINMTDSMTVDTFVDRFKFRVPQPIK